MRAIYSAFLGLAFAASFLACKKTETAPAAPARDKFLGLYMVTACDLPHMPPAGTPDFGIFKGVAENELIFDAGGFVATVDGDKLTFGRNFLDPETAFTGTGIYIGGNVSVTFDIEATATVAAHSGFLKLQRQ